MIKIGHLAAHLQFQSKGHNNFPIYLSPMIFALLATLTAALGRRKGAEAKVQGFLSLSLYFSSSTAGATATEKCHLKPHTAASHASTIVQTPCCPALPRICHTLLNFAASHPHLSPNLPSHSHNPSETFLPRSHKNRPAIWRTARALFLQCFGRPHSANSSISSPNNQSIWKRNGTCNLKNHRSQLYLPHLAHSLPGTSPPPTAPPKLLT